MYYPSRTKEFINNFLRVFNKFVLKLKNHSCDKNKVLKKVMQVSCPHQLNGIDCGMFVVVICLHIFDGAQIDPTIFSQHKTTKLRMILLSVLVQDRNRMQHNIHCFVSLSEGTIVVRATPSRHYPHFSTRLPSTIKLTVGGKVLGTVSLKTGSS